MNTNGGADAPTFGQYCYDYADTRRSEVSSDYLALLGAYTFQGRMAAETAHFCGIFDGTNTMFPDVFSKSVVWWHSTTVLGLSKDLLKYGRETSPNFNLWNYYLEDHLDHDLLWSKNVHIFFWAY